jgi:hypothetical protein
LCIENPGKGEKGTGRTVILAEAGKRNSRDEWHNKMPHFSGERMGKARR